MPLKQLTRIPQITRDRSRERAKVRLCGRDFYLGPWGSEEAARAYDRVIAEWLLIDRKLPDGYRPDPSRKTGPVASPLMVGEFALRYLNHAEQYYRKNGTPTSEVHRVRCALRALVSQHSELPVAAFSPSKLIAVRDRLVETGLARVTINGYVSIIKAMFRWGTERELVPAGVFHTLQAVRGPQRGRTDARDPKPVGPVSEELVEATLPHLSAEVAAMARLQLLTGMRSGELCAMRAADIDTTEPIWIYTPQSHKTEHHGLPRRIHIGARAQGVLSPLLKRAFNQPVFGYRTNSYRRAIARACARADIEHWTPHQLRHAAATRIEREFGVDAARAVLGHASPRTTEVYVARDATIARDAIKISG